MSSKNRAERQATEAEFGFLDAASNGEIEVVRDYIRNGGDVNVGDHRGMPWGVTALMLACDKGQKQIVEELLAAGANWKIKDYGPPGEGGGNTALHYAANGNNLEIVKLLLGKGAKIDTKGGDRFTLLMGAATKGNVEMVRLALDAGAVINQQDSLQGNSICYAAREGHAEIVRLLIDRGADPNGLDGTVDNLPLACAIQGSTPRRPEVVKILIEAGADVQKCSQNGMTPFEWAVRTYTFCVFELLIGAGCKVNLRFRNGRLPLDEAVDYSQTESWSPEQTAANKLRWDETIKILRDAGAKSDADD